MDPGPYHEKLGPIVLESLFPLGPGGSGSGHLNHPSSWLPLSTLHKLGLRVCNFTSK